ncbi:MAG: selenocysteine-specific translation elongation factor [Planctomycetes bacterium]|nr:selenocysteine-specific translation elongation factor [Planctomycetota bacterium]
MSSRFCILGTAGHIDHGKSTLVKALTGTDPDRLPEEKARGMTIELGFAHLTLPAAGGMPAVDIGIVDVPGHERFVRTMVAGATGFDLAMLVVAADDGVMPQTREHIEILDLLGIGRGLVVLSKVDLVLEDRSAIVREQIADAVGGTALESWPIIGASAKTGIGLDVIRATLRTLSLMENGRESGGIFRLSIDRVFSVHGRGTVVTGSVLSGRVTPGETLELQPVGIACKVREVQSHGSVIEGAVGGQRAALNVTGVDKVAIDRGMELATPGYLTPTRYLDARVRALPRLKAPIDSHTRLRISIGTTEAIAMLVVIGGDEIAPGESGFVQLRFQQAVVAAFGQRFIVRNENAQATLGGGSVVRPVARRARPKLAETRTAVERAASADGYERIREAFRGAGFQTLWVNRVACEAGIEPSEVEPFRARMLTEGILIRIGTRECIAVRWRMSRRGHSLFEAASCVKAERAGDCQGSICRVDRVEIGAGHGPGGFCAAGTARAGCGSRALRRASRVSADDVG